MAENKQQQEIKEISEKLEQGVKELFESEKYKEFLHTMSKFHNYSLNNTMLIAMQKPDATLVAGYTAWQHDHDRHVMKGEKGIRIFAPAPYKIKEERDKIDPVTNKPVLDENNSPVKEVVEVKIPAFKLVSVFDVSQTQGKELPTLGVDELLGDVEDYVHFFDALKRSCPVPVEFEKIASGAKGYYHQEECRIAINEGMSEVQNVKTLVHEMAHQKLHAVENMDKELNLTRSAKEVEAESIAYVICQHYGIDTAEYSFGYLAGWSEGKDTPELKASLDRIRKASNEMINEIDSHIAEINLEIESEQSKHMICYLKISNDMGAEYKVDRIAGTPEQIESTLKEIQEARKNGQAIDNIEEYLESKQIAVLELGGSKENEPIHLVHSEYEYDKDTNEIYRDGAALGREMTREEKALRLAISIDAMAYDTDLYEYQDTVDNREEFVLGLRDDLLSGAEQVEGMKAWFQELIDEGANEAEDAQKIVDEINDFLTSDLEHNRYRVAETSDAFEPGEDFAIWDMVTDSYVMDSSGCIVTFPDMEQAEMYLTDMKQERTEPQEIVGRVEYANGEYFEYTDKERYLSCIRDEIEYASTTGFRFTTLSDDPELKKAVDDEVYNMFGEKNPHSVEYYSQDKKGTEPTISFYVAECMEFPSYGEYHEGLTLKEAFDLYDKIPDARNHSGKGIGFDLQDGSIYAGQFDLMQRGVLLDETINYITHYRNSELVQQAISECRNELKERGIIRDDGIMTSAYVVGEDHYLSIQRASDNSWDYSLYDKEFNLIDGGQVGDGEMSFAQARNEILESFDLMQENIRSVSPEMVEQKAQFREAVKLHEQGLMMDDFVLKSEASVRIDEVMDMAFVSREDFSEEQMQVIGEAAHLDVPLSSFVNPEIPAHQMAFALEKMKEGYDAEQITVSGKQISLLDHPMTEDEITKIKRQMEYDNIPKMLYTPEQWREIENGMKRTLDVTVYAKPEYDAGQMKEIRIGLDKGTDVESFLNPDFSDKQMREIRRGVEAGFDVSSYAKPEISAGDMRKAFFALKDKANALESKESIPEPDKDTGLYRYYSTQRPVSIGTYPGKPENIQNFDDRQEVCGGQMSAWGYLEYKEPLTEKQMSDYELKPAIIEAVAEKQPSFSTPQKESEGCKKPSVMENLRKKMAQIAKADAQQSKNHEKEARE